MYKKLNDQEVKIKKIVVNSLRKYYKLQDEKDDLTVEMTAISTSLLKISQDIHYLKPDKYFISAVLEKEEKETFVSNYSSYINMLDKYNHELKELIEFKYKLNYSREKISLQTYKSLTRLSYYLSIAVLLLAVLDHNIDYTIDNYIEYFNQYTLNYQIKEHVKVLCVQEEGDTQEVFDQISKIFNIRKEEFLSIILNDNLKSSRYILKLFYTFAFLHPNIDFNLQNFKIKAKNTKITNKEMKTILNFKNK